MSVLAAFAQKMQLKLSVKTKWAYKSITGMLRTPTFNRRRANVGPTETRKQNSNKIVHHYRPGKVTRSGRVQQPRVEAADDVWTETQRTIKRNELTTTKTLICDRIL